MRRTTIQKIYELFFCICYEESLKLKAEEDLKANNDKAIC